MREFRDGELLSGLCCFGFGFLVVATYCMSAEFSTIAAIDSTSGSQFFTSVAIPFFIADLLANALFISPNMTPLLERRQFLVATIVLVVAGAVGMILVALGLFSGITAVIVAVICGIGSAFAFLWWTQCLSWLVPWRLCFYVAAGLIMQQVVKIFVVSGVQSALPYIGLFASVFSMGFLAVCYSKASNARVEKEVVKLGAETVAPSPLERDECGRNEGNTREQISPFSTVKALLLRLWKPLVGGLICALIAGFSINKDYVSSEVTIYGQLVSLGVMIACVALLIIFRRTISVAAISQILLPVATALLLVAPFLMVSSNDFLSALVSPLNTLGFFSFDVLLWVCTLLVAPRIPIATSRAIAVVQAACAFAMALGLVLTPYIEGSTVQVVCLILLAAYLLAFTLSATLLNRRSQREAVGVSGELTSIAEAQENGASVDSSGLFREKLQVVVTQSGLSPREKEVFFYLARGHGSAYIAEALMVSPDTVKTHTKRIYRKLGVTTREELLALVGEYY